MVVPGRSRESTGTDRGSGAAGVVAGGTLALGDGDGEVATCEGLGVGDGRADAGAEGGPGDELVTTGPPSVHAVSSAPSTPSTAAARRDGPVPPIRTIGFVLPPHPPRGPADRVIQRCPAMASPDPRIGTQMAEYHIEGLLGHGGMGVVYLVEHINIVPVTDAGEADGELWIAMRYVEGSDLGEILRSHGPLNPIRAVSIL